MTLSPEAIAAAKRIAESAPPLNAYQKEILRRIFKGSADPTITSPHASMPPPPEKTWLYRHYDQDGRLLYVGISNCPEKRLRSHRRTSPWKSRINRVEEAEYPSREEAMAAEKFAIQTEHPLHNIVYNPATMG